MIADKETNFVYLSNLLQDTCPKEFQQLKHWFDKFEISNDTLPNTKDLWVVDFMPLQVCQDYFVQYKYDPDYLKSKKERPTRTDPIKVCNEIAIVPNKVDIVLDGGNVVKSKTKAILTTKVFKENPYYPEHNLIAEIKNQLQVEQVIVIPQEPKDFVGHADGMVRFIDETTVLINQYPKDKIYQDFGYAFRWSLRNAGLQYVELPYTSWQNEDENDATGCYINFLEVDKYIFYPAFAQHADQLAFIQLQRVFKDREIIDIDCCELAKRGGVLNCATWNIWRD
jgi:agmatine deiminase